MQDHREISNLKFQELINEEFLSLFLSLKVITVLIISLGSDLNV
jgi:hypothetical protein